MALHRAALSKLGADRDLRTACLELVERWLEEPELRHARPWLDEWRAMLLGWSVDQISGVVLDVERGESLRKCSPLGPALSPRERWAALAEAERDPAGAELSEP